MAYLTDGFPTTVDFALAPSVHFKIKSLTPPGMDGGGENDTTTMENTQWRTRQPKFLVTLSEMNGTAAYDPVVYDEIVTSLLNKNGVITINFPDGSTLGFYGWLDKFTPNEVTEGSQPTASFTIIPSNQDSLYAEQAPDYTA